MQQNPKGLKPGQQPPAGPPNKGAPTKGAPMKGQQLKGQPLDPNLWRRIVTRLQQEHPTLNRVWFPTLKPYQLSNGVILAHCEKPAHLHYLQSVCADAFSEAAQNVTGRLVSVAFHCENMPRGGVFTEQNKPVAISPDHTFDEFVTGRNNQLAHAACVAVSRNPGRSGSGYNPLFIHGGVGLGKTHLLQAVCAVILDENPDAHILYLSCEAFVREYIQAVADKQMAGFRDRYRGVDMLVVDDVHFLAGHEHTQEEFFHTFNALHDAGKQVVFSADCPPGEIPELEERLVSRFNWGMVARIDKPGFETRVAIVKKKAQVWGLDVPDEVTKFIAARHENNIREIEGALKTLGGAAKVLNEPVSIEMARETFGHDVSEDKRPVTMSDITEVVTKFYGVKLTDLQGKRRNRSIAWPRQVCMYLAREHCRYSFSEVGGHFGNRDHTTVIHGCNVVAEKLKDDRAVADELAQLEAKLGV